MREAPHFTKLNLQVTKIETVARRETTVKILDEMTKKATLDPKYKVPDGYKLAQKEDQKVDYRVPEHFPITESKRVVVEVLD